MPPDTFASARAKVVRTIKFMATVDFVATSLFGRFQTQEAILESPS